MCILRYAQNRLGTKCSPCSSFCLSQRERQLHENLFTAPTIVCHPNATVPQGKACLLLLAGKCCGLCPPPYLANQASCNKGCAPSGPAAKRCLLEGHSPLPWAAEGLLYHNTQCTRHAMAASKLRGQVAGFAHPLSGVIWLFRRSSVVVPNGFRLGLAPN